MGQNKKIEFDLNSMPKYKQEILANATLELVRDILSQPGGREALERKKTELGLTSKQRGK